MHAGYKWCWYVPYWPSVRHGTAHLRDAVDDATPVNDCAIAGFARPLHVGVEEVAPTTQVVDPAADHPFMRFKTSNSVYELDLDNKRVRRVCGLNDPTPRQGADGEWRTYVSLTPSIPEIGVSVFFDWTGHANGTLTSMIEEIER